MSSNPFHDHNDNVAHSTSWDDPPDVGFDWDIVMDYIVGGVDKRQDDANDALVSALRVFRDSVIDFAKENEILLSEAEGAAKEWFDDKWSEIFEVQDGGS